MRILALVLLSSIVAISALPLAAASPAPACGAILAVGIYPWTICTVNEGTQAGYVGACLAWRLFWGPAASCPLPLSTDPR